MGASLNLTLSRTTVLNTRSSEPSAARVWSRISRACRVRPSYRVATNPSSSFFYLITAVHGLHLIGGLVVLGRTAYRTARGAPLARLRLSTELCATYWHFLLLVWFALFGLLLHG